MTEDSDVDEEAAEKWYQEVLNLRAAEARPQCPKVQTPPYSLPCRPATWVQLGMLLSAAHSQFYEEAPDQV